MLASVIILKFRGITCLSERSLRIRKDFSFHRTSSRTTYIGALPQSNGFDDGLFDHSARRQLRSISVERKLF